MLLVAAIFKRIFYHFRLTGIYRWVPFITYQFFLGNVGQQFGGKIKRMLAASKGKAE